MESSRPKINWTLIAIFLVVVIIAGVVVIGIKCRGGQPLEVTLTPEREVVGTIYVGGAVNVPGIYSIFTGDTLKKVIAVAGGLKSGACLDNVELIIGPAYERTTPQKIDINRAQAWLLEALPSIGKIKAQAIVDYREQHGFYHDIYELLNVPGISESILDDIKDFITVNG
jgi:competence protein ComEA